MTKQVIFDIGCNNGDDTDFYLKKGFRVVAIDADKSMCGAVSRRFSQEIENGDCTVVYGAFSDTGGDVRFFVCDVTPWNTCDPTYAEENMKKGVSYREVIVPGINMKEIILSHGIPYYLKIDIEGFDIIPLRGLDAKRGVPKYISLEIPKHNLELALEEILLLGKLGYKKYYFSSQVMLKHTKAPKPAHEGKYAEFCPAGAVTGLFGDEIDGEWVSFDRAVEKLVEFYRHHLFFKKWFSQEGQSGGTIASKIYLKYLQHVRRTPGGGYDLHARTN